MTRYVVDASTAIKLYLPEPLATEAASLFALLDASPPAVELHVPDLFYAECGNILWKQVPRGNVTRAEAAGFSAALRSLSLVSTPTFELLPDALDLALAHGISVYDACYAALAARHGVTLVTADRKLEQRLAASAVAVVWLGNWAAPSA